MRRLHREGIKTPTSDFVVVGFTAPKRLSHLGVLQLADYAAAIRPCMPVAWARAR
jgi:hypothetical protein